MFHFEYEGFEFSFDDSNLYLSSSVLNLHPNQDNNLLAVIGHLQDHMKFLLALGNINKVFGEVEEAIRNIKNARYIPPWTRDIVRQYSDAAWQSQIELWYSYIVEQPAFPIMPDSNVWGVWEAVDEATRLLDRLIEYERLSSLAQHFPTLHDGYVYLFHLSTGHYKIGFSNNPQRRGREIVSGLPLTLNLIHQIPSNQIACLEAELHKQYAKKRHGITEWFDLNDDDVSAIKSITERKYPWIDNPEWAEEFKGEIEYSRPQLMNVNP